MLQLTDVLNVIVSREQFDSIVTIHPCSNVIVSRAACWHMTLMFKDELMLKPKDVSKRFIMLQLTHVLNVIESREQFDSNVTIHPCYNVIVSRAACWHMTLMFKDELMLKPKDVSKRFLMLQLTHVLNVILSREQFDY